MRQMRTEAARNSHGGAFWIRPRANGKRWCAAPAYPDYHAQSLYILLTAERSRQALANAETVIVDEIHAIAGDKRGAHLTLSLQRLDMLAGRRLQRIGLSATQKPIEDIARLLVGTDHVTPNSPQCAIVDMGHRRPWSCRSKCPIRSWGRPVMWGEVYDRRGAHSSTAAVFFNTATGGARGPSTDHRAWERGAWPPITAASHAKCVWRPKKG